VFIRQGLLPIFLLVVLAWAPFAEAAPFDRSDLDGDGTVGILDLEIFSTTYLEEDHQTVDWCNFYDSSISNPKYFRTVTSQNIDRFQGLMDFIAATYDCQATASIADKSDLNGDGAVDLADLAIFSTNYLEMYWETVDWCVFQGSVLAGAEFEGRSTKYFLRHFETLLVFINDHYACGGTEPPPNLLALENIPKYLTRVASAADFSGGYFITDPIVGSLFIYDEFLILKSEIKGLSRPLGVALDLQGRILVGNDGRDNIEVYDPATGELLAVFGEGLLKMPTAITVDNVGNIYVTDSRNHRVQVFDSTYNPIRVIGKPGVGDDTLQFPVDTEIIMTSGGGTADQFEIFVADQGNDRVQVFDADGNWLRSITKLASGCNWAGVCSSPAFVRVQALAKDSFGRLHVLDNFAASVLIFDPADGAYLGSYAGYGEGAGTLGVPMDVLVSTTDMAIVTAGDGDRIEMFTIQ
jgi:DNA-binding beta-propeller fold protein YncE